MNTYQKYIDQYQQYHASREPGRKSGYSGRSILKQLKAIRAFAAALGAKSYLDYGCGRGEQYEWTDIEVEGQKIGTIREYFSVNSIALFDPAVPAHMQRPSSQHDLVVCTDVLEHVHENDVDWVLADILGLARKGVFLSIASYKAGTTLPNGENAHTTIRSMAWWKARILQAKSANPNIKIKLVLKHKIRFCKKLKLKWEKAVEL